MVGGIGFGVADTGCVMIGLAFMAAANWRQACWKGRRAACSLIATPFVGMGAGALYGLSIRLVESVLVPVHDTAAATIG